MNRNNDNNSDVTELATCSDDSKNCSYCSHNTCTTHYICIWCAGSDDDPDIEEEPIPTW